MDIGKERKVVEVEPEPLFVPSEVPVEEREDDPVEVPA